MGVSFWLEGRVLGQQIGQRVKAEQYMIIFGSWNHHVYRLNDENKEKRENAIKNIKEIYNLKPSIKVRHVFFTIILNLIKELLLYTLIIIVLILLYTNNLSNKPRKYNKG